MVPPNNREELKDCKKIIVSLVYFPLKHKDFYKLILKKIDKIDLVEVKMKRFALNLKMHLT